MKSKVILDEASTIQPQNLINYDIIASSTVTTMLYFLVQVAYTPASWRNLILDPQNRQDALSPVIKNLGGKIECSFLSFGDYDAIGILSFPDNITAAALSMALMSGGGVKRVKTTPLVTWEEGVKAMGKARKVAYKPPDDNPMIDRG